MSPVSFGGRYGNVDVSRYRVYSTRLPIPKVIDLLGGSPPLGLPLSLSLFPPRSHFFPFPSIPFLYVLLASLSLNPIQILPLFSRFPSFNLLSPVTWSPTWSTWLIDTLRHSMEL